MSKRSKGRKFHWMNREEKRLTQLATEGEDRRKPSVSNYSLLLRYSQLEINLENNLMIMIHINIRVVEFCYLNCL